MPFPALIFGGIAVLAGGIGVKKFYDAKVLLDKAKKIGHDAESKYQICKEKLDHEKNKAQHALETLGELKVHIFSTQIKHLVDTVKKVKASKSSIQGFEQHVLLENLPETEKMIELSLEIESGIASGAAAGALTAIGAYGAAGTLATATTGTAIASLSGAAATNATLAFFGGGALAAGGFGMAGGMAVLGGLVLGPALAIGGFILAGKAEKALTNATQYAAEVDEAIKKIESVFVVLRGIQDAAKELARALTMMVERFERVKVDNMDDKDAFNKMLYIGKNLKDMLNIPILLPDGSLNDNVKIDCSGYLSMGD